jgi:hypothetical protein
MGYKKVIGEWPNIPLSKEDAKKLVLISNNPVYESVVRDYHGRSRYDNNPPEDLGFGDICYWLDYEANMDDAQDVPLEERMFTRQAVSGINRWLDKYNTNPIRPW